MKKISGLLRLYRIDAFLITLLAFVSPFFLFGDGVSVVSALKGFFVSGVLVNFIYSFNSLMDYEIDKINKPYRPLATGVITFKEAKFYCAILFINSLVLPFFVFESVQISLISLFFPIIGVLYSNGIYPFKKVMLLASFLTTSLLVLPVVLSLMEMGMFLEYSYFPICLFIYCMGVIPLKDIEDITGDVAHGSQNWAAVLGTRKLIFISIIYLTIVIAVSFFVLQSRYHYFLCLLFIGVTIVVQAIFVIGEFPLKKLYKTLIITNILLGASALVLIQFVLV